MSRKSFQELNLTDAFLFAVAMSDPVVLKDTLEILLEREIGELTVSVEQSLLFSSDNRSVRLDVFCNDDVLNSYNVEMQGDYEGNLPKRSRYYQAQMDVHALKPGDDIDLLKPNYVIFICNFDPFGYNLYRYTFENVCQENGMPLGDGTKKIFFNIRGRNVADVSTELISLLKYMRDTTEECVGGLDSDSRISRIHSRICELKKSREWERCYYMRFDELIKKAEKEAEIRGHAEGHAEGRAQGSRDMLKLVAAMIKAGESSEAVARLSEDEKFLSEMCEKYLNTKE